MSLSLYVLIYVFVPFMVSFVLYVFRYSIRSFFI